MKSAQNHEPFPIALFAEDSVLHIYQDADITHHPESSVAIQKGIEIAFDEIGHEIEGYKIVYKYLDHRGNVIRSKRNYETFINDPNALAIYSGIHSPPLIKNRDFINQNQALTLVLPDRNKIDLHFIQTCFAFTNNHQSLLAKQVLDQLIEYSSGEYSNANDLKSAVGFIHAYDLTKLLIQAIKQTGLSGNIPEDRNLVRLALESLKYPVEGLVKTYRKPFSVFNRTTNPNAHEALHVEDYCMGMFGSNDEIIISQTDSAH